LIISGLPWFTATPEMSDSESTRSSVAHLLRRARAGDEQCRDDLFAACRSYLGVVARAEVETWLQAKVDASDVVQQSMLEAYRDFTRFEGESPAEWFGWLRRILAHNVTDFVRRYGTAEKRAVQREVRFRDPGDSSYQAGAAPEPAASQATPSQNVALADEELRMAAALSRLPADYQEVIQLRNLQCLPFDEVAARMGRSRPAVQMLWMRAIKRLRAILDEESG
jgi:RNA polymerase sigma-70 factor (ECF subfamily)